VTKTQYYTATTLDGYIADENNSLEWLFEVDRGPEPGDEFTTFFAGVGAMAMGATTYEWVLEHAAADWQKFYADTPSWVFTHRDLPRVEGANVTFVQGAVAPVHEEMTRAANGKNIWIAGGGDLVGQFADQGLLDEIYVGIAPVTLGAGAPLLPRRLGASQLELVQVSQSGQFVQAVYRVKK
jgi:dihydrofolate reductase